MEEKFKNELKEVLKDDANMNDSIILLVVKLFITDVLKSEALATSGLSLKQQKALL